MAAIRSSLLAALLLLGGCGSSQPEPAAKNLPESACQERVFKGSRFTLCKYDAVRHRIEMFVDGANAQPLRTFEALEGHLGGLASDLLFAMNGGMYDDAGRPIGLYVENGRQRHPINLNKGPGNFHLMPNGVFAVDAQGRVSVTPSSKHKGNASWATQSGPMLVIEGKLHPAFQPDGESVNVRNGVGACADNVAWFAISYDLASFGRFARLFRDELKCPNALFLDGSVSSLWEAGARQDRHAELGPMIAVFKRR